MAAEFGFEFMICIHPWSSTAETLTNKLPGDQSIRDRYLKKYCKVRAPIDDISI